MSLYEASDTDQSLLLSNATLGALGLAQQPFGSLAPNSTCFSDETTTEQIADVKQALINGDDLLLILGHQGAGKTLMLRQLNEQSGNRIQCFPIKGSERFSTINLFAGLLEAFKLSPPEKLQDILDDLIPCLQTMMTRNTLSVIVLDNAQNVKDYELTQLLSAMLYLNSHDDTIMRIVMAAEPDFEKRIPELVPEGADLRYSSLTISGMTSSRSKEFIEYRLAQAGLDGETPFTDRDIAKLIKQSNGLPGPLQQAAAEKLNEQYGPVTRDSNSEPASAGPATEMLQSRFSKMALGSVAVFCIALGVLMFLPGKSNEDATRYTQSSTEVIDFNDSTSSLRLIENSTPPENNPSGNAGTVTTRAQNTLGTPQALVSQAPTGQTPPSRPAAASASEPDTAVSLTDPQAQARTTPVAENTTSEQKQIVIVDAAQTAQIDETLEPPTTDSARTDATAITPPQAETTSQESTEPSNTDTNDEARLAALESASWILLQDKTLYTVQMSASRDRDSIVKFLNTHADSLPPPNSIYTFRRNGSNWYALLHGLYDSIDAAKTAVGVMPASALTNQPWIRSVARVQEVLKSQ